MMSSNYGQTAHFIVRVLAQSRILHILTSLIFVAYKSISQFQFQNQSFFFEKKQKLTANNLIKERKHIFGKRDSLQNRRGRAA